MKTIAAFLTLLMVAVLAAEREPPGSKTSYTVTTNGDQLVYRFHNNTSGSNWVAYGDMPIAIPYTYKDADSGIIFYVESDGRHVTAISPEGKILWTRDPFADAHLPFYRTQTPRIVQIGRNGSWLLFIKFNSSQCGSIDVKTGHFTFTGQL
jgi:hypothetical protein